MQKLLSTYIEKLPECVNRDELQKHLKNKGIPSMVYYVKPMHMQGAFEGTDSSIAECAVTEKLSGCVLSLPIHPYMKEEEITQVCDCLLEFVNE